MWIPQQLNQACLNLVTHIDWQVGRRFKKSFWLLWTYMQRSKDVQRISENSSDFAGDGFPSHGKSRGGGENWYTSDTGGGTSDYEYDTRDTGCATMTPVTLVTMNMTPETLVVQHNSSVATNVATFDPNLTSICGLYYHTIPCHAAHIKLCHTIPRHAMPPYKSICGLYYHTNWTPCRPYQAILQYKSIWGSRRHTNQTPCTSIQCTIPNCNTNRWGFCYNLKTYLSSWAIPALYCFSRPLAIYIVPYHKLSRQQTTVFQPQSPYPHSHHTRAEHDKIWSWQPACEASSP